MSANVLLGASGSLTAPAPHWTLVCSVRQVTVPGVRTGGEGMGQEGGGGVAQGLGKSGGVGTVKCKPCPVLARRHIHVLGTRGTGWRGRGGLLRPSFLYPGGQTMRPNKYVRFLQTTTTEIKYMQVRTHILTHTCRYSLVEPWGTKCAPVVPHGRPTGRSGALRTIVRNSRFVDYRRWVSMRTLVSHNLVLQSHARPRAHPTCSVYRDIQLWMHLPIPRCQ